MIQFISSTFRQPIASLAIGTLFFIISTSSIYGQDIQFGLGASLGLAPSLSLSDENSSATFYSVYADLTLSKKIIGRAQLSVFNSSSFTGDLEGNVESGFQFNGSIGYNIVLSSMPKLELPVMGTVGYASIKDINFNWPGMQLGVTFAPKYMLTEKIAANVTLRYLKGNGFDDGRELSQTDVSFGMIFYLFSPPSD